MTCGPQVVPKANARASKVAGKQGGEINETNSSAVECEQVRLDSCRRFHGLIIRLSRRLPPLASACPMRIFCLYVR